MRLLSSLGSKREIIMSKLRFPLEFLDVLTLQDRWQCSLNIIQALAELKEIRFFVRPVVLEIALERIFSDRKRYKNILENLSHRQIDHRDVYLLFKSRDVGVKVRNFDEYNIDISVEFCDLVIPITDVEAFENRCLNTVRNTFKLLSKDFTCVLFNGQEYTFGVMQAKVLERLWKAYQDGVPWVYGKHILSDIGSGSERIQSIFSHNKYWRRLVLSDGNGKYRLNLANRPNKNLIA